MQTSSTGFHLDELEQWFMHLVVYVSGAEFRCAAPFAHIIYTGTHVWNALVLFSDRVNPALIKHESELVNQYNALLESTTAFFESKGRNFDIYIPTDFPARSQLLELMSKHNIRYWGSMICMELDLHNWWISKGSCANLSPVEGFTIEEVDSNDEKVLADYWGIVARSFLANEEARFYADVETNGAAFVKPLWRRWIGIYMGTAVCTISLSFRMASCKTAFIYDVCTLEHARRKGFATLMLHHALKEAYLAGIEKVALQGEPDGVGIYRKQGFVDQCEIEIHELTLTARPTYYYLRSPTLLLGGSSCMSESSILNLDKRDPFADIDAGELGTIKGHKEGYVHIRIQPRTNTKSITTVEGLPSDLDLKRLLRAFKKNFSCNGAIVNDPEMGKVIQLQGDQRQKIYEFLTSEEICTPESVKVHGF